MYTTYGLLHLKGAHMLYMKKTILTLIKLREPQYHKRSEFKRIYIIKSMKREKP